MDARTKKKIMFINGKQDAKRKALAEYFDMDQLEV